MASLESVSNIDTWLMHVDLADSNSRLSDSMSTTLGLSCCAKAADEAKAIQIAVVIRRNPIRKRKGPGASLVVSIM